MADRNKDREENKNNEDFFDDELDFEEEEELQEEIIIEVEEECEVRFDGPIFVNIENIEDQLFDTLNALLGESILIITETDQLNLFGQAFRPIFCGTIFQVNQGSVTLFPVNIKMINAPFFEFPTPLSIPLEKIAQFTPNFDCNQRIPLT